MARGVVDVEGKLAVELRAAALGVEAADEQVALARVRLTRQLLAGQALGYSVRALSEATGLTPKRVRLLLREAA